MTAQKYDVIIVGAGAGGGMIAGVLAEAGKRVLLLERGRDRSFEEVGRDHLRNQRVGLYGTNAGPDGSDHPRVEVNDKTGRERVVLPHHGGYGNNAAIVGGGTRVYGGQAWRFHPLDFAMASTYGVPAGSSLADWPLGYDELAPWYEMAEHELGVCGDAHAMSASHLPSYNKPYPLPPFAYGPRAARVKAGADALGWKTFPVPLAINTVPRAGRAACARCRMCPGFACPTDAKNGSQNTLLPRALETGRCDLVTGAMARRVETDNGGRAVGVSYWNDRGELRTERAPVIVVAGGAIETARLLLNSASTVHPHGLGNAHDQVGRHLQGHYYPGAAGAFAEEVWDGLGPGPSTATARFNHGNDGIVGGGLLLDDFIMMPIAFYKGMFPPGTPRWGQAAKDWMRTGYKRSFDIKGPVQEIPSPHARITLDPAVRDRWNQPVARLSGATHPETVRTAAFMHERAKEWLRAMGATAVWGSPPGLYLSSGQHQAGTCRMGDDPAQSVADRFCRVHGHDNLYIGDGSVHVTNGGFNPFLTIMALACRTADHITRNW